MKNPYDVLGVSQDASDEEIKKVYIELARKWHPDLNKGSKKAEEKSKEINASYELIKSGKWQQQQQQCGGININNVEEMFRQHFNDVRDPFRRVVRRKQGQIQISFEEAYSGCQKNLKIQEVENCKDCSGIGFHLKSETCKKCNGTGQIVSRQGPVQIVMPCNSCRGFGRPIGNPCDKCKGSGKKVKIKDVVVNVPPNTIYGTKIHPSSDLEVVITYLNHSEFSLTSNLYDVISKSSISMFDAILGTDIIVNTLSGKKKVKIPSGTQHDTVLRVKEAGFRKDRQGDHLIAIKIEFPKAITEEQKQLLIQLKDSFQQGD